MLYTRKVNLYSNAIRDGVDKLNTGYSFSQLGMERWPSSSDRVLVLLGIQVQFSIPTSGRL